MSVLIVASGGWSGVIGSACEAILTATVEVGDKDVPYSSIASKENVRVGEPWADPRPQSRGEGWCYEVFTPPRLYRNEVGEGWYLTPPHPPEAATEAADFPVVVEELCVPLFRLQLVGFGGEPGRYFGLFENVESGETRVGRPGRTFDDLQLVIETLQVAIEPLQENESEVRRWVARARIRDLTTDDKVDLVSLVRIPAGARRIKVRVEGDLYATWKHEDEAVDTPRGRYLFEEIVSDPAKVVLVAARPEEPIERREFYPRVTHTDTPRSHADLDLSPIPEAARASEAPTTSLPVSSLFR